ncbi:MAG TPA: SDR family NAD(P)-dependent oxidoreductase [Pirellulales bacterium]|jgi:nucleoside-diphosphate-sugar epimerase
MSQRYVVTGAAGFIASRVARLLLDAGHEVVGVDNLNDAYDPRLKQWRLAKLQAESRFRFTELDVAHHQQVSDFFAATAADGDRPIAAVLHLAARAGVRQSVEMPHVYVETNVTGTLNVLEACRTLGISKFVLASTSSLYGDTTETVFREDMHSSRPLSPYAASKKGAEAMAFAYHRLHNIDTTVVRYFTVYGPAGRPDMSVFRFVRQLIEDETITIFGDGSQRRDFTFVDDIARGTILGLKPIGYEVINLGSDRPVELMDVLEKIAQLAGKKPDIRFLPAHAADVPATWADVTKARNLLGWQPQVSLDEGLRQSIQWYLENRSFAREIVL